MEENKNNPRRRLFSALIALAILVSLFLLTAYAASLITREVKENYFHTGIVRINLNDGNSIIQLDNAEPGMTLKRDFFIRNESTDPVYFKIYFSDTTGALADVLEVSIREGEQELFRGTLGSMTRLGVTDSHRLELNEQKNLTIYFHFPEEAGNDTEENRVSFALCATAVQTRNNPNREFE